MQDILYATCNDCNDIASVQDTCLLFSSCQGLTERPVSNAILAPVAADFQKNGQLRALKGADVTHTASYILVVIFVFNPAHDENCSI